MAVAWLDSDLNVVEKNGDLLAWLIEQNSVHSKTSPLCGLTDELLELRSSQTQKQICVPDIAIVGHQQAQGKFSVRIYWDEQSGKYLVHAYRPDTESELGYKLIKEMRARRIAEEQAEKQKVLHAETKGILEIFAESAPAAIVMLDDSGAIVQTSRDWVKKFNDIDSQRLHELLQMPAVSPQLSGGRELDGLCRFQRHDGSWDWVRWIQHPWFKADGNCGGNIVFGEVLTSQIEHEGQLVELNEQLQITNQELVVAKDDLEHFAHVASHDLRAPIRAIHNTTEWLREDMTEEGATPQVSQHLDRLEQQSARAAKLVVDLLEYSRIGRKSEIYETVDVHELVSEILSAMPVPDDMSVTISTTIPFIYAPRVAVDLTIRNLIDNAIKYHDGPSGRIHISGHKAEGMVVLEVEDDGPGIAPTHHQTIFEPFQKLESYDLVPGSGIGLANVRKTVETYGGTAVIISPVNDNRGTRFSLTWQPAQT